MTLLKKIYWSSRPIRFLFKKSLKIKAYCLETFLSDEAFTKNKFKTAMGYDLDLENPITLNEKINWLKLNNRKPIQTILADKYKVREYVNNKIGDKYLIPLLFETKDVKDLTPENLPEPNFIVKVRI